MRKLLHKVLFVLSALINCSLAYSQNVVDPGYQPMTPFEIRIHSLCKEVTENGKTTDKLSANDLADLPLGIARKIGNGTYVIAIDSAYSEERGWFFSAFCSVTIPGTTQPIAFAAKNIAFNAGGLTSSSQVKLQLVSEIKIKINESVSLVLAKDGSNYIEWDCNGFKAINLKGSFIFSDGFIEPDPTLAKGATAVTAGFEINTKDLNDILLAVSITPFRLSGVEELTFEIKNAVADFSDIANPKNFSFPKEYQQTLGSDIQLWRGFFIQEADIHFNSFGSGNKKPTLLAKNLLIDDLGVSGTVEGQNLLALSEGSAGGWPLSIDDVSVKFLLNKVVGGGLKGQLNVPFLGDDPMPYAAQMEQVDDNLNYKFSITTTESKTYKMPLNASLVIGKGSVISIERRNGDLIPSALLNGMIDVHASPLIADGIKFEKLGLTSVAPYVTSGIFSLRTGGKEPSASGFPLRIDSLHLSIFQGEVALGVAVSLNLMNSKDKGFSANTYIQVLAKMEETTVTSTTDATQTQKKQQWKFEKVKVNDIALECKTAGGLDLKGRLTIFDNDPTYGNGFRGSITFNIAGLLGKGVTAHAYFGNKEALRYWHVDAYVPVGNILIVPPALFITGFMGGASYHMKRAQSFAPDFSKLAGNNKTGSGQDAAPGDQFVYVPDENTSMAFMAGVTLVAGNEKAFNSDAVLEVAFNAGGGLKYISFVGSAFFVTSIADRGRGTDAQAPIYANLTALFDNDNHSFHANMKTYINVANVIKGIGPNNLVGEAVIHIDQHDWYIYIGRPSQMMGLEFASLAVAKSYFMIGTQIEDMPPPPLEVQEIFGQIDQSAQRDVNTLGRGRGFATGAHFRIGFDSGNDLNPFQIVLVVGAGADVMIRDYGDAHCQGRSGKIGIDGWYASGQAYVFMRGKIGVAGFDIVSLGAAALLQAKLPNPSWLKGQLAGRYKILGGLISGSFNLSLVIGDKCEIVNQGNELGDIKVIEDLKPDAGGKDISVFTATQVSFNTSLETEFSMTNLDNKLNSYRIRLQDFSISKAGVPIKASIDWNSTKDVAILRTAEILPPQSELKAIVKVYWEKKVSGGNWEALKKGGQIDYEVKETSFTTGTAPDFIPEENVSYSHPIKSQYNFHRDETNAGYVKLGMGQEYLFKQDDQAKWDFIARFTGPGAKTFEVPLTYDVAQAQATFSIPKDLALQTVYKFSFVKKPQASSIDQNLQREEKSVDTGKDSETKLASNKLEGTITQAVEKEIYTSAFRTSQFKTFEEKINSLSNATDQFDVAKGMVAVIGKRGSMTEAFDEFELKGGDNNNVNPLIQVVATADNSWFKEKMSPLLYDPYAGFGKDVFISWRNTDVLGLRPLKGVTLTNDIGNFKLQDSNITSLSASTKSSTVLVGYYLSYYTFWDFDDLKTRAAAKYLDNVATAPPAFKNLVITNYTDLIPGYYPVEITYALPGAKQPSFKKLMQIKF